MKIDELLMITIAMIADYESSITRDHNRA